MQRHHLPGTTRVRRTLRKHTRAMELLPHRRTRRTTLSLLGPPAVDDRTVPPTRNGTARMDKPIPGKDQVATRQRPAPRTLQHPEWTFQYDGLTLLNPALKECRDYICDVVRDIVTRYDVDGLHIDDYFYPYPAPGVPSPTTGNTRPTATASATGATGDGTTSTSSSSSSTTPYTRPSHGSK